MFWICTLLALITYPIVFIGSMFLGLLIIFLSEGNHDIPNPFISPNTLYQFYREQFRKLGVWYKRESK